MNNKKIFLPLLVSFVVLTVSVCTFAKTISTESEDEDGKRVLLSSEVSFGFLEPSIFHDAVNFVSAIDGILNLKSSVDLGSYVSATAQMKYYFNDSTSSSVTVDGGDIAKNKAFYIGTSKFQGSYEKINYQIIVTLKKKNDETDYFLYWPQQLTASSDTFHTAQIITYASENVEDTSKETIVKFPSGNQQYGDTTLYIPAQGLSAPVTITITQLPITDSLLASSVSLSKTLSNPKSQMIAMYEVSCSEDIEILKNIYAEFFYGIETSETKFSLKYRTDENSDWEQVSIKSTDLNKKLVSANIKKLGQYAIFIREDFSDNSYRPEKRTKTKARISNGTYEGFRFNNLQEGDVVKIYNISGKKIAELTSGDSKGFVWEGKKGTNNGGEWAESGTYVYQIKLKSKGKLISGTIAFIW